jgi:hypothetical protein
VRLARGHGEGRLELRKVDVGTLALDDGVPALLNRRSKRSNRRAAWSNIASTLRGGRAGVDYLDVMARACGSR